MNEQVFYDEYREIFGRIREQVQVEVINLLLAYMEAKGLPIMQKAYVLATAFHESRFLPVREGFADTDEAARRVVAHRKYGKADRHTGQVYYGRGLVQLTWADNYKIVGSYIGVNLYANPDLALLPENAVKILVDGMLGGWFNGAKRGLGEYINENRCDLINARRTVNITNKAQLIAGYAKDFKRILEKAESAMIEVKEREQRVNIEPIPAPDLVYIPPQTIPSTQYPYPTTREEERNSTLTKTGIGGAILTAGAILTDANWSGGVKTASPSILAAVSVIGSAVLAALGKPLKRR